MAREDLEAKLTNLRERQYETTSPEAPTYNCFAWAAGDDQHWWEPPNPLYDLLDPVPTRYWPEGALPELTVEGLISAFATQGYLECGMGELEQGFEKIAIFVQSASGWPTHAARQLASGVWTSKIGEWEDIAHSTLQGVECPDYGRAVRFLRRRRQDG